MNRFIIASKHPAFGKLYLGKRSPVKSRTAAKTFRSFESAQDRIIFWQGLVEREGLDPKFFGGMYVEEK